MSGKSANRLTRLNPRKLLHSKWTAVRPVNRERHFMVTRVRFDEEDRVEECVLEAVTTGREQSIDWRSLRQADDWLQGWK